jgi:uncharacterized membrane-anchored protein YitT (DUF2179 family)
MLIYFALLGLPEWTTLSKTDRQAVCKRFIRPLFRRWQVFLGRIVFLIIAIITTTRLLHTSPGWHEFMTVFVAVLFGSILFDQVFVALKRHQIIQFIRNHAKEIESAA